MSPGCPCAPGCPGSRRVPRDASRAAWESGLCPLREQDVTGTGGSGDTRSCPHPAPVPIPVLGVALSHPELGDLGSVPSAAGRVGLGGHGEGMRPPALQGLAPHPASACGPGPAGGLILQIPPGISPRRGPLRAGSSRLAGSPPGKRSPALAGGKYLRGARPPHAGCQRPGAGPAWVRRNGWARGPPAPPGWAQEGRDGTGDTRPSHVCARIVCPDSCRGAREPGIPWPCRRASQQTREDGAGGLKAPPQGHLRASPSLGFPAALLWQGWVGAVPH